jgi:hypothetical protein
MLYNGSRSFRKDFSGYNTEAGPSITPETFIKFNFLGWSIAEPIQNTLAELYLKRLGVYLSDLDIDWHVSLRFLRSAYHSKVEGVKRDWPGLVAMVHGYLWPAGDFRFTVPIGTSITYLEADVMGKS